MNGWLIATAVLAVGGMIVWPLCALWRVLLHPALPQVALREAEWIGAGTLPEPD